MSVKPRQAAFVAVLVVTLVVGRVVFRQASVLPVSDEPLSIVCESPAAAENIRAVSAGRMDEALFPDQGSFSHEGSVIRFVDHVPELHITGQDAGTDADAVAVLDKVATNKRFGGYTDQEFIVASKTDGRMMLVGARSGVFVIAERAKKKWVPRFRESSLPCRVRAGPYDETLFWRLLRSVEPDDSQLSIGVSDYCNPVRRLFSAVTLGKESVIVTVFANPLPPPRPTDEPYDPGFCTKDRAVVVDLGEPIGDRVLVDGSWFPPRQPFSADGI